MLIIRFYVYISLFLPLFLRHYFTDWGKNYKLTTVENYGCKKERKRRGVNQSVYSLGPQGKKSRSVTIQFRCIQNPSYIPLRVKSESGSCIIFSAARGKRRETSVKTWTNPQTGGVFWSNTLCVKYRQPRTHHSNQTVDLV